MPNNEHFQRLTSLSKRQKNILIKKNIAKFQKISINNDWIDFFYKPLTVIQFSKVLHIVEFQGTKYDNTKKNIVLKCLEPLVIGKSSDSHAGVI